MAQLDSSVSVALARVGRANLPTELNEAESLMYRLEALRDQGHGDEYLDRLLDRLALHVEDLAEQDLAAQFGRIH